MHWFPNSVSTIKCGHGTTCSSSIKHSVLRPTGIQWSIVSISDTGMLTQQTTSGLHHRDGNLFLFTARTKWPRPQNETLKSIIHTMGSTREDAKTDYDLHQRQLTWSNGNMFRGIGQRSDGAGISSQGCDCSIPSLTRVWDAMTSRMV